MNIDKKILELIYGWVAKYDWDDYRKLQLTEYLYRQLIDHWERKEYLVEIMIDHKNPNHRTKKIVLWIDLKCFSIEDQSNVIATYVKFEDLEIKTLGYNDHIVSRRE